MQVDYREPLSGVGRMPGGRSKSEGGPNDREEETAMLIEKAILPLFKPGFTQNVTVSLGAVLASLHSPTAAYLSILCSLTCFAMVPITLEKWPS